MTDVDLFSGDQTYTHEFEEDSRKITVEVGDLFSYGAPEDPENMLRLEFVSTHPLDIDGEYMEEVNKRAEEAGHEYFEKVFETMIEEDVGKYALIPREEDRKAVKIHNRANDSTGSWEKWSMSAPTGGEADQVEEWVGRYLESVENAAMANDDYVPSVKRVD